MKFWPKKDTNTFDVEITAVLEHMAGINPATEEYQSCVNNLETLTRAKTNAVGPAVKPETIIGATTNLLGILMVINYEHLGVVSSKAFGLISKTKL